MVDDLTGGRQIPEMRQHSCGVDRKQCVWGLANKASRGQSSPLEMEIGMKVLPAARWAGNQAALTRLKGYAADALSPGERNSLGRGPQCAADGFGTMRENGAAQTPRPLTRKKTTSS